MDNPKEIMTIEQAAEFMQVHYQTMWTLVKTKKISAKKVGREWRILKKEIIAYMESHDDD